MVHDENPRGYAPPLPDYNYSNPSLVPPALPLNMSTPNCGSGGGDTALKGLRIASLFIIWTSSSFAATFPVVARRSRVIHIPLAIFESVPFPYLFLFLNSSPQDGQIFRLWGHHRHWVHPPPRPWD